MKKEHRRKMIAPIVVAIFMLLYYALYFGVLIWLVPALVWKCILGIFPVVFGILTLWVCIERINEIKDGQEDDISKY